MGVFMLPVLSTREFVLGSNCELLRIFCSPHFGFGEDFKGCRLVSSRKMPKEE